MATLYLIFEGFCVLLPDGLGCVSSNKSDTVIHREFSCSHSFRPNQTPYLIGFLNLLLEE